MVLLINISNDYKNKSKGLKKQIQEVDEKNNIYYLNSARVLY